MLVYVVQRLQIIGGSNNEDVSPAWLEEGFGVRVHPLSVYAGYCGEAVDGVKRRKDAAFWLPEWRSGYLRVL